MSFGPNPGSRRTGTGARPATSSAAAPAAADRVRRAVAGVHGTALAGSCSPGLALVGLGLFCVWLEIGRPLRALHVFFNPRTSWMTREAFVATLLFPAGLAAAAAVPGFVWMAAALALDVRVLPGAHAAGRQGHSRLARAAVCRR